MKIRNGFVSNSSSSSFIIIGNSGIEQLPIDTIEDGVLKVGGRGTTEFGWEYQRHDNVYDRINFCFLQATANGNEHKSEKLSMLEDCILKKLPEIKSIEWSITSEYDSRDKVWGYIDHQSSACEGANTEMFDSMEQLTSFIFDQDSYIQTDNDNH